MRPQLIPKKHFTNKAIATQLERAIKVASARCGGLEMLIMMRINSLHV